MTSNVYKHAICKKHAKPKDSIESATCMMRYSLNTRPKCILTTLACAHACMAWHIVIIL